MIPEAVNIGVLEARLQGQPQLWPEIPGHITLSPGLDRTASKPMDKDEIDHRLRGAVQKPQAKGPTVVVLFPAIRFAALLFCEAACEALLEREPGA